jgi:radical SAM protein with 4Fe4S-binding SPASM domain
MSEKIMQEVESPIDHNYHQISSEKTKQWEAHQSPAYHEYRKNWEGYPRTHTVGRFPLNLDIEATTACNLKCDMCPRTEMVKQHTMWKVEAVDYNLYTRLIDEGAAKGLCAIKYNFVGEPTLNPRLVDMIRYAKNAGVADVMFNTNGTLLDEKLSRRLIEAGLDKLFFSFDSPYREHYNAIRIGADYDKVLANIKRFMEIRKEMNSHSPFTRISMVLMQDNHKEWEDFVELFSPIVDAVGYVDYLDQGGISNPERSTVKKTDKNKKFCCPQLWQRMFVHPDGVASVCCMDLLREIKVGTVDNNTVEEIWTGKAYQELRELHMTGRFEEIPTCASCALAQL